MKICPSNMKVYVAYIIMSKHRDDYHPSNCREHVLKLKNGEMLGILDDFIMRTRVRI